MTTEPGHCRCSFTLQSKRFVASDTDRVLIDAHPAVMRVSCRLNDHWFVAGQAHRGPGGIRSSGYAGVDVRSGAGLG